MSIPWCFPNRQVNMDPHSKGTSEPILLYFTPWQTVTLILLCLMWRQTFVSWCWPLALGASMGTFLLQEVHAPLGNPNICHRSTISDKTMMIM